MKLLLSLPLCAAAVGYVFFSHPPGGAGPDYQQGWIIGGATGVAIVGVLLLRVWIGERTMDEFRRFPAQYFLAIGILAVGAFVAQAAQLPKTAPPAQSAGNVLLGVGGPHAYVGALSRRAADGRPVRVVFIQALTRHCASKAPESLCHCWAVGLARRERVRTVRDAIRAGQRIAAAIHAGVFDELYGKMVRRCVRGLGNIV